MTISMKVVALGRLGGSRPPSARSFYGSPAKRWVMIDLELPVNGGDGKGTMWIDSARVLMLLPPPYPNDPVCCKAVLVMEGGVETGLAVTCEQARDLINAALKSRAGAK